jgi:hypothetical protein
MDIVSPIAKAEQIFKKLKKSVQPVSIQIGDKLDLSSIVPNSKKVNKKLKLSTPKRISTNNSTSKLNKQKRKQTIKMESSTHQKYPFVNKDERNKNDFKQYLSPVKAKRSCNHEKNNKDRRQSFTFIVDMAITSTPTRNNTNSNINNSIDNQKNPLASTPVRVSHDPAAYHPSQTIRNKRTLSRNLKTNCPAIRQQVLFKPNNKNVKNKHSESLSTSSESKSSNCSLLINNNDDYSESFMNHQVSSININSPVPAFSYLMRYKGRERSENSYKHKATTNVTRKRSNNAISNNNKRIKRELVPKINKKLSSIKPCRSNRVRIGSNYEISLEDLLYKPRKLRRHHHHCAVATTVNDKNNTNGQLNKYQASNESSILSSIAVKSSAIATNSKVYYL